MFGLRQFPKAFDTLEHWANFEAFKFVRIDSTYTKLLEHICNNVTSTLKLQDYKEHILINKDIIG